MLDRSKRPFPSPPVFQGLKVNISVCESETLAAVTGAGLDKHSSELVKFVPALLTSEQGNMQMQIKEYYPQTLITFLIPSLH